jgi:hypothetical protein
MKSYLQWFSQIGFIDYAKSLIAEMEIMAAQMKIWSKGANNNYW